jgi:5-oxoprolinase (ATP-hydrolysing)
LLAQLCFFPSLIVFVLSFFLRFSYEGTDTAIMATPEDEDLIVPASAEDDLPGLTAFRANPDAAAYARNFIRRYQREYGFTLQRPLIVDDVRARAIGRGNTALMTHRVAPAAHFPSPPNPACVRPCYFAAAPSAVMSNSDSRQDDAEEATSNVLPNEDIHHQSAGGRWLDTPVHLLSSLGAGDAVSGPAIIIDSTSTLLIEPHCCARVSERGDVAVELFPTSSSTSSSSLESSSSSSSSSASAPSASSASSLSCDPIQLGIFSHRFMSIAEQMGRTLQRTSVSTNIKEVRIVFSF